MDASNTSIKQKRLHCWLSLPSFVLGESSVMAFEIKPLDHFSLAQSELLTYGE